MGGCIGITRARNASVNDTSENSTRTNSGERLCAVVVCKRDSKIRNIKEIYKMSTNLEITLFLSLYSRFIYYIY